VAKKKKGVVQETLWDTPAEEWGEKTEQELLGEFEPGTTSGCAVSQMTAPKLTSNVLESFVDSFYLHPPVTLTDAMQQKQQAMMGGLAQYCDTTAVPDKKKLVPTGGAPEPVEVKGNPEHLFKAYFDSWGPPPGVGASPPPKKKVGKVRKIPYEKVSEKSLHDLLHDSYVKNGSCMGHTLKMSPAVLDKLRKEAFPDYTCAWKTMDTLHTEYGDFKVIVDMDGTGLVLVP
jgi:hypothetical protein